MKKFKTKDLRLIISAIFFVFCISIFGFNLNKGISVIKKIAAVSASAVLPTGADFSSFGHTNNNYNNTSNTSEAESEYKEDKTTLYVKETTETTQDTEKENKGETPFSQTPEDIKKLTEKYQKVKGEEKKGGKIAEQTYKNSGVTNSYGNVRVKNINDTSINIKKLLGEKADLKITDKNKPSVLLFHTHTTETYQILDRDYYLKSFQPRSNDPSVNMVRVGVAIEEELEKAGYKVIHDTNIYDYRYNGAYARSREAIEKNLEKYPDIQIVLDIHRDAIEQSNGTKIKPVCEIEGKKCAQIMIISGCQESGNGISGFDDWRYNLIFAVQLQNALESKFSGITRPLYFCPRKYNMDTSHCSLLIEMGSDANTLEEAVYSGKCLGNALAGLMDGYIN